MKKLAAWMLALVFVVGSAGCAKRYSGRTQPPAQKGILDLRSWDFQKDGPVKLSGQWEFYWKDLRAPGARPPETEKAANLVQVPSFWKGRMYRGKKIPARGYASYRLRVLYPADRPSTLYIPDQKTSYRVFVNLEPVARSGVVGRSAKETRPEYRSHAVRLPEGSEAMLIVQVANFHYRDGGMNQALILGSEEQVAAHRRTKRDLDFFLQGVLLIMGLYHIALFVVRRKNGSALYFGLYCLMIAVWMATATGERYLLQQFPGLSYEAATRILYVSVYLAVPLFTMFTQSIFPDKFNTNVVRVIQILVLLLICVVLFTPPFIFTHTMLVFYVVLAFGSTYAIWGVLRAWRDGLPGARLFLGGFVILVVGVGNDVLYTQRIIHTGFLIPLALFFFIFAQAAMLARLFAGAFNNVEELSGELEQRNQELDQKNAELGRLDQLKDEFLANTSHELRTPLNGIIGIAESIIEGATGTINEETRDNLRMVSAGGRRLSNLVNDILDFSKLKHQDIVLRRRPVDVSSLVEIVLAISRHSVGDKDLELLHDVADLLPADADEDRLEQILHNLVGNAIKFTKSGEVRVSAAVLPEHGPGGRPMLEISVTDTGIGIPEKKKKLIFESFTQADGSIAREYGGTGLGLSVTKKLVELHGGILRVESQPGKGSRFVFTLASAAAENDALGIIAGRERLVGTVTKNDSEKIQPGSSAMGNGGFHTLIVDDDPVNLQVLRNLLVLQNHSITEASNGHAALKLFDEGKSFDLILLDVMMPGLSGYEVCKILRENHSQSELPIIMLTAKNRVSDLVAGLESGANDYLAKPFDSHELIARVNTMIQLGQAAKSQSALAMLESEMEMARGIQQALLPDFTPNVEGLKIVSRYRSMINVGGDYYDFQAQAGALGAIVADVSGHGVPAALIVSIVKMAFQFQTQNLNAPDELLAGMNEIILGNTGNEFVTASYFFIDTRTKTLKVGNAGHPPLLVWKRKDGVLSKIRPMGRLLGVMRSVQFSTAEISLEEGDRIVAYTDGILEAANLNAEHFGEERFHEFLAENADVSAEEFADGLLRRVTEWSGGEERIDDDIALLVVDVE